ncbi:hypothetical protein SDC9_143244 [bioreactor metagenome]|uniref:Uncharacterized protein n=1 Tax=bioreactor metagenome TaxID=1076179 RepID=A0A645E310_9ZZZZ
MGCVRRVAAEDAARRDDAHRRLVGQHGADLHRAGLRTQDPAVREIKRILRVARRMILRRVQRVEIVEHSLDLRPFGHEEPHPPEQRHAFVGQDGDRVFAPAIPAPSRQGKVERAAGAVASAGEPLRRRVDQRLDFVAPFVEGASGLLALFGSNAAHLLRQRRKQPVAAEIVDPDLFDGGAVGGRGGLGLRLSQRPVDFFNDRIHKKMSVPVKNVLKHRIPRAAPRSPIRQQPAAGCAGVTVPGTPGTPGGGR